MFASLFFQFLLVNENYCGRRSAQILSWLVSHEKK